MAVGKPLAFQQEGKLAQIAPSPCHLKRIGSPAAPLQGFHAVIYGLLRPSHVDAELIYRKFSSSLAPKLSSQSRERTSRGLWVSFRSFVRNNINDDYDNDARRARSWILKNGIHPYE